MAPGDATGAFVLFQRDTKLLVNKSGVRGLCRMRGLLLGNKGGWGREFPRNDKAKGPERSLSDWAQAVRSS